MRKPLFKVPKLEEVFATDENNRIQVARAIGKSVLALPEDIAQLYRSQYEAVRFSFHDRAATLAGLLYISCAQRLTTAIMALLRRYPSQAFRETRVAVEAAGIAHEVRKDQESCEIYLADRGDPDCRKAARNRFGPKIFKGGAKDLKAPYDKASELSHNNRRSLITHLDSRESYNFQDLPKEHIPLLAINYLLWICVIHVNILDVADIVFSDIENDAVFEFKKERKFVAGRLARFHQKSEQDLADSGKKDQRK